jgi:hypothetical protein
MSARHLVPLLLALGCSPAPVPHSERHVDPLVEICGNGFDDDLDGRTDCEDPACEDPLACPVCGDGVHAGHEPCDGEDLGVLSCESLGYVGGVLHCSTACEPITTDCVRAPELCDVPGDEDHDGAEGCADTDCAGHPECLVLELVEAPASGRVTEVLPAVVLRVLDGAHRPFRWAQVSVQAPPGAMVSPARLTSDGEGLLSFEPRLGLQLGSQVFTAALGGQTLAIAIEAVDPPPGTVHTVLDIDRIAGTDVGGPALAAHTGAPIDLAVGADGTLYVAEACRVLAISAAGELRVVAGSGSCRDLQVAGLAAHPGGGVLVSDAALATVWRMDAGPMEAVAGGGVLDPDSAEGGDARAVKLGAVGRLAANDGQLYLVDAGLQRVLRVDLAGRTLSTVLRTQDPEPCASGALVRSLVGARLAAQGAAVLLSAELCGRAGEGFPGLVRLDPAGPTGLVGTQGGFNVPLEAPGTYGGLVVLPALPAGAVDAGGNLLAAAADGILRVDGVTLETRWLAVPDAGFDGELQPLLRARFRGPSAVAVDGHGNAFVADTGNGTVRRIAGLGDSAPTEVTIEVTRTGGLAMDLAQGLRWEGAEGAEPYVLAAIPRGRSPLRGHPLVIQVPPDLVNLATSSSTDATGRLIVPIQAGVVPGTRPVLLGLPGLLGIAAPQQLDLEVRAPEAGSVVTAIQPVGMALPLPAPAPLSNAHVSDLVVSAEGTKYLVGTGALLVLGADGVVRPLGVALPHAVRYLALDESRRLLYAAASSDVFEVQLATGKVTTYAGGGQDRGDGGPANQARLSYVTDIDVSDDALWIADYGDVRRVDRRSGVITTVSSAAGGRCAYPLFDIFTRRLFDAGDDLWVTGGICKDSSSALARLPGTGDAVVEAFTGNPTADGILLEDTRFQGLTYVGKDTDGSLLVGEYGRLRRVNLKTRIVDTLAGNGTNDDPTNELAPALQAVLPNAVAVGRDPDGHLWIVTDRGSLRLVW